MADVEAETGHWTNDEAREIARRFGAARGYKGWSQRELARRLGVDAKTVNRYENFQSRPKLQTLVAVVALTGVRPDWFDLELPLSATAAAQVPGSQLPDETHAPPAASPPRSEESGDERESREAG